MCEVEIVVHPRSHWAKAAFTDDVLHVWVFAPPLEGAANEAVIALLARVLGIPRRYIAITRGATSRHKRVAIAGLSLAEVRAKTGE